MCSNCYERYILYLQTRPAELRITKRFGVDFEYCTECKKKETKELKDRIRGRLKRNVSNDKL